MSTGGALPPQRFWFNYTTGHWDLRETPQSDEDCQQYIDQHPAARILYFIFRESKGLTPYQAMTNVRCVMAGVEPEFKPGVSA